MPGRKRRGRGGEAVPGWGVDGVEDGGEGELWARWRLGWLGVEVGVSLRLERPGERVWVGVSVGVVSGSSSESDMGIAGFPLPPLFMPLPLPENLPLVGRRTDSVPFLLLPGTRRTGVSIASSSSDVSEDSLSSPLSVP